MSKKRVCRNQVFLIFANNSRSKQNQKNCTHPFVGIYPSSFTNVHFSIKIEFLNGIKCRWGSRVAVSSATSSWQSSGEGSGVKSQKIVGLFTNGGQINSSKYKKLCKLVYFKCKFIVNML